MSRKWHFVCILSIGLFFVLCEWVLLKNIYLDIDYDSGYMLLGPIEGIKNPIRMMWWLALYLPAWGISGWLINLNYKNIYLVVYRMKNVKRWWLILIGKVCVINMGYFILMNCMLRYLSEGNSIRYVRQIILLAMSHSFLMIAIMCMIFLNFQSLMAAFTVIMLLEIFSAVPVTYGWLYPKWWIPVWGICGFSQELIGKKGFVWENAVCTQCILACIIMMLPMINKKILIRSMDYEKAGIS